MEAKGKECIQGIGRPRSLLEKKGSQMDGGGKGTHPTSPKGGRGGWESAVFENGNKHKEGR